MTKNRSFLASFIDQEVYVIPGDSTGYQEEVVTPAEVNEKGINYSGDNSKGVIVIVQENTSVEEYELLDNILKSINLNRAEIALIVNDEEFVENSDKLKEITATKIISFGAVTTESRLLGTQTPYTPTTNEGRMVIMADTLAEINSNKELKRSLWTCLKENF